VRNQLHKTPLHYSAKEGKLAICQLLLSYGADPNLKNRLEETHLHFAAQKVSGFWSKQVELFSIAENDKLAICQLIMSNGTNPNASAPN
jgi:hypothetical protein